MNLLQADKSELYKVTLTSRAVAASVLSRAAGSVFAGALLSAILPKSVRGAQLAAILSAISGRAVASTVDWRALRVVLAVATILTILAECVEWTRSSAGFAIPSHFAGTLSGPRMTQHRIAFLAFTKLWNKFDLQGDIMKDWLFKTGFSRSCDSPLHNWDRINRLRRLVGCTFHQSNLDRIYRCR